MWQYEKYQIYTFIINSKQTGYDNLKYILNKYPELNYNSSSSLKHTEIFLYIKKIILFSDSGSYSRGRLEMTNLFDEPLHKIYKIDIIDIKNDVKFSDEMINDIKQKCLIVEGPKWFEIGEVYF